VIGSEVVSERCWVVFERLSGLSSGSAGHGGGDHAPLLDTGIISDRVNAVHNQCREFGHFQKNLLPSEALYPTPH